MVVLIAAGWLAARVGWLREAGTRDLSNLVFMLLTPALLFRTMSAVRVQDLAFGPVGIYFVAAIAWMLCLFAVFGRDGLAAVKALSATFSNTVMIGIPLVTLAFGQAGLVVLLTLISLHALILLTLATVLFEWVSHASGAAGDDRGGLLQRVGLAVRNGVLHPVPLPILLGLAWAQTGWAIAPVLDRPLHLLGTAFGPMALVLVGATVAQASVGAQVRLGLVPALLKNLGMPVLMTLATALADVAVPVRAVLITAAALPAGANVFLFAQKYQVGQAQATAAVALSTLLGLVTLTAVLAIL